MKHIYNKLIRDRIPKIIENDHKTCATRILNDEEYLRCLKSKLLEECHEVIDAEGEDIKKEIADVLEVLEALENTLHIDYQEVLSIKEKKARSNGAQWSQLKKLALFYCFFSYYKCIFMTL